MVRADHRVSNRSAHIAVGVDMDGVKHVLGIWIQDGEGASFWAHVCADLANRGVQDVLIVCCDGLTGLPEAVEATWPDSMVQTCVVHLIRASMRFVAYGDRKGVAAALRPIYTAPDEEAARRALDAFRQSDPGRKYPQTAAGAGEGLGEVHPLPGLPPGPAPGHLHHQRDRVAEPPSRAVRREPRPLPLRRGGGQTAVAGDLQHRGPPGRGARQGEEHARPLAQGQGQTRRGTGHHQLEAGPGPARRRLPRPNQPPSLTEPAYTETLTGSGRGRLAPGPALSDQDPLGVAQAPPAPDPPRAGAARQAVAAPPPRRARR